jgi:hypothetical protein
MGGYQPNWTLIVCGPRYKNTLSLRPIRRVLLQIINRSIRMWYNCVIQHQTLCCIADAGSCGCYGNELHHSETRERHERDHSASVRFNWISRNYHSEIKKKTTPWSESASELYRPSDRRLSAKWLPTFAYRGCHVVSVTDPYCRILGSLDRSRYFSIK